jgi:outer membrane protein OmpA-like peptidoglycan-associated protein
MINRKTVMRSLAGLLLVTFVAGTARAFPDDAPRAKSATERRADRHFLGQNYHRALSLYKKSMEKESDPACKAALCLKVARLYFMVRDHASAALHFGMYMETGNELPSAADVCDYLDALRFLGERQKAEAVCLHYAYENVYSRHQRYRNALNALTMKYDTTGSDYAVTPLHLSGGKSEYWMGSFLGHPFYAVSRSHFNSPGKLFFHRTRYRSLNEQAGDRAAYRRLSGYFSDVPRELQCGPVSFSPDASLMVATEIVYNRDERVRIDEGRDLSLRTRLVHARISADKDRFTRFQPLFHQEPGASYAHPFLHDDGRSILFASDMSGGYGGFDLYVSRRDEGTGEWSFPVNLGPTVNTEGDEIFPVLFDGELFFASNGHLGLGAYDLFRARHDGQGVVANTLYHLPYPVNSSFNDFYIYPLDGASGYIASDRDERARDNLFFYRERDAMPVDPGLDRTEQSLLNGDTAPEQVGLGREIYGELLLVLYFDFDKARLNAEATRVLKDFVKKHGKDHATLHVVGYSDEIGKDDYNHRLSERRARVVANWLDDHGSRVPVSVEGRGKIVLTGPGNGREEKMKLAERIEKNWRARRVEIYTRE